MGVLPGVAFFVQLFAAARLIAAWAGWDVSSLPGDQGKGNVSNVVLSAV